MCRNIKTKLLSIITLIVFVCIAGLCVGCSKKNKVGLTASELNIEGKTPISYSEFVNDSGADIKDDDIGFKMEKGANVRVDKQFGFGYAVNLGIGINAVKASSKYSAELYDYDYYVLFKMDEESWYIKGEPVLADGNYKYTASFVFAEVADGKIEEFKTKDIGGLGIMVLTEKSDKSNKIVVSAEENDNVRTMESVVNSARLSGTFDNADAEIIKEAELYVPCDSSYIVGKGLYAERVSGALTYSDIIKANEGARVVYYNGKRFTAADKAIPLADVGEENSLQVCDIEGYVTIVDAAGKFYNCNKVKVADAVISEQKDLKKLYCKSLPAMRFEDVYGYFVLAKDVKWDGEFVVCPPFRWSWGNHVETGSRFFGTLDGDGHILEYAVCQGGLFGYSLHGTVKNISLIIKAVKEMPETTVGIHDCGDGNNLFLARRLYSPCLIENVYATYDIDDFTPDVGQDFSGRFHFLGFGGETYGPTFKNVVLDLSKVKGVIRQNFKGESIYGVVFFNLGSGEQAENVHIVWDVVQLKFWGESVFIATNDELDGAIKLDGITRHKTFADFADATDKVGSFKVTPDGVVWVG